MGEKGPVIALLSKQWLTGEISAEIYFAQIYAEELPRAAEQVEKELIRRRQLAIISPPQAPAATIDTEPPLLPTVAQKIVGLIKKFL